MDNENDDVFEKFEWKADYETGIPNIDLQHKEMFKRIDILTLAIYDGQGWNEVNQLIKFLEIYVMEHFDYEEEIMTQNKFPGIYDHRKKHEYFKSYLEGLVQEVEAKGIDAYLAIKVEREMKNWWEEHILGEDKLYVPYVENI